MQIIAPAITDEGINALQQMTQLRELNIGAPITDNSVPTLKKMTHLDYLRLQNTSMSEKGVEELRSSLRNTEIDVSRPAQ